MPRADSPSPLGSRYDNFLYADVGASCNGMPLTVLSLMARLDIDPWEEAARLAQLPGEAARERLSVLLGTPKDGSTGTADAAASADRLIALLPGGTPSAGTRLAIEPAMRSAGFKVSMLYLVIVTLVLIGQWLLANPPAPTAGHATAPISTTTGAVAPALPP